MLQSAKVYPNNLKNRNFGCAKTPGLIDHTGPHISNIGPCMIDQSREFSRQPKSDSSSYLGIIRVAARDSLLSQKQVQEVFAEFSFYHPNFRFETYFLKTKGDLDLLQSLREMDKTDFFTKEIDDLVLRKDVDAGIHSAKDLPDPLSKGLICAAVTKGLTSADALVLREGESLNTLLPQAKIATSSYRREECVRQLRKDLCFVDIRGSIEQRVQQLLHGAVDGVVIAEAALLRLGWTHLNRILLPGETAPLQGRLAVVIREGDRERLELFKRLDLLPEKD